TERGSIASSSQCDREIVSKMRQGPMTSGARIAIGTIKDIAKRAAARADDPDRLLATLDTVAVRVVATTSSEDAPIGASKRFAISSKDGQETLSAPRLGTAQMYSRADKKRVLGWLEQQ